jgi:hypothetical protein
MYCFLIRAACTFAGNPPPIALPICEYSYVTVSIARNNFDSVFHMSHRYLFFYMLPYLPEIAISAFDFMAFAMVLRRKKPKDLSPVTDEDIEAYKYTFSKPGEY